MPKKETKKRRKARIQTPQDENLPLSKRGLGQFYNHVCNREVGAARRVLSNVPKEGGRLAWQEGYLAAMGGMISSLGEPHSILNRLITNEVNQEYSRRLLAQSKSRAQSQVSDPYDRGYFSAWVDLLLRIDEQSRRRADASQKRTKVPTRSLEEWFAKE